MTSEIEICECRAEDVDDSLKDLWLGLAHEMFNIERFILPSKTNSDRWAKFVREELASGRSFLLIARMEADLLGLPMRASSQLFS